MNDKFDLLSIGDASFDVFINPLKTETQCKIDSKECLICFSYGDKIPVSNINFSVGGNAANNAVGASRFGIRTGILVTIGSDNPSREILSTLTSEKVDTKYIVKDSDISNYSTVINYSGERTIFVYHSERQYLFPEKMPQTSWLYLTSMGKNFLPFYKQVLGFLKDNPHIKLAFNPGSWQIKMDKSEIAEVLAVTDLIFVNREEAEKLTDLAKGSYQSDKELLQALSKLGPKTAVITDGGNGSMIFDGNRFLRCGILPIDPYERTGAGDAFGSGFLAAIIKNKPLEEALLWGTSNSASVIGYTGSQKGLLREEDMDIWLERCKSSNVKVEEL